MGDYDIYTGTIRTESGFTVMMDPSIFYANAYGFPSSLWLIDEENIKAPVSELSLKKKYKNLVQERFESTPDQLIEKGLKGAASPIPKFSFNPIKSQGEGKRRARSVTPRKMK
jgi:hypothetical protein